jgi:nucleoside phosphorylase
MSYRMPPAEQVLIAAAFEGEMAPLRDRIQKRGAAGVGVRLETIGIGLVEASLGMAAALAKHKPSLCILIGTAGAYPDRGLKVGDVVEAAEARIACPAHAEGRAALPTLMKSRVVLPDLRMASVRPRRVIAGNTLSITTDDALAWAIRDFLRADIEHLEVFAAARACELARVDFACILGIANAVGDMGRRQWHEHHEEASRAVVNVVAPWFGL